MQPCSLSLQSIIEASKWSFYLVMASNSRYTCFSFLMAELHAFILFPPPSSSVRADRVLHFFVGLFLFASMCLTSRWRMQKYIFLKVFWKRFAGPAKAGCWIRAGLCIASISTYTFSREFEGGILRSAAHVLPIFLTVLSHVSEKSSSHTDTKVECFVQTQQMHSKS